MANEKVTIDGKILAIESEINKVSSCTPRLEGSNTDAKKGTVILYDLRTEGGRQKIKTDTVNAQGDWGMSMPSIKNTQTYFLRFIDKHGNESGISRSFTISCEKAHGPVSLSGNASSPVKNIPRGFVEIAPYLKANDSNTNNTSNNSSDTLNKNNDTANTQLQDNSLKGVLQQNKSNTSILQKISDNVHLTLLQGISLLLLLIIIIGLIARRLAKNA